MKFFGFMTLVAKATQIFSVIGGVGVGFFFVTQLIQRISIGDIITGNLVLWIVYFSCVIIAIVSNKYIEKKKDTMKATSDKVKYDKYDE